MIRALILAGGLVLATGCVAGDRGDGCCGSGSPAPPPPASAPPSQTFVYRCTMDGGARETPGPCPICGMTLDERYKVAK